MHAGSLLEIQCTRIDHNDVAVDARRPYVAIYCRKHSIRNQKPRQLNSKLRESHRKTTDKPKKGVF